MKYNFLQGCQWLLLSALVLAGCAQQSTTNIADEHVKTDISPETVQPLPDHVEQALLHHQETTVADSNEPARFDLSVKEVPAQRFFDNLMKGAQSNIVVHPDVRGVVSLNLKNVTVDDVLMVVRDIYGYEIKKTHNIYTVYSRKITTKVFPINYIDVERTGVSDTSVLIGNTEPEDNSDNNSDDFSNSSSFGDTSSPSSRVKTTSTTNFWQSLQETLATLIGVTSEDDQRRVIAHAQAGVVVVSAMPDELIAVEKFLQRAQLSVKRQVLIEAKVVEVQLSDGYEAGVNWDQINGQLLLIKNVSEFDTTDNILSASEDVGEIFSSIVKVGDISRLLSLLQTQGEVQVLSRPRVATVNNQKAVIRVGSDEFFVTGISSSTTSNASSTISTPNIELSSFFSGISLDVTPQIADNNDVILHIHPVVSSVADQQKDITVGNENFSLPLALRDIRESDSIVRASSGEIIVLGGLMQEKLTDLKGKRPILGDVPLFNSLFKTRAKNRTKSELIILLKPVVIDGDVWSQDINQSRQRMQGYYPNR